MYNDLVSAKSIYEAAIERVATMPDMAALAGRRVCIVGGTGLIGGMLTRILAKANELSSHRAFEIVSVSRRLPSPNVSPYITNVQGSAADSTTIDRIAECTDFIYIAGAASDYLSRIDEIIETQFVGLQALLSRLSDSARFTYISSTRVYGRQSPNGPITEDQPITHSPMHLDNICDSHKHFGESLCLWHAKFKKRHTVVARISNIYGANSNIRSETAISDMVRQAIVDQQILLSGSPDSTRNWCSVVDLAQGLIKALIYGRAGEAYNIGSLEHLTSLDLGRSIAHTFADQVQILTPENPPVPSIQLISIEKAIRELGYAPEMSFEHVAAYIVAETAKGIGLA